MNEENPVFKVTDRRLFNADGSPREVEEGQKAEAPVAKPTESAPASDAQPAESTAPTQSSEAAQQAEPKSEVTGVGSQASAIVGEDDFSASDDTDPQGAIPGADDPASLINFLMSIASNAAVALGMMEHPVTHERTLEPEMGKHWIDVLGMLETKTRGNLSPQEKEIFEGLLADLRMQYVSLGSSPRSKAQRGFSGSDITGGK